MSQRTDNADGAGYSINEAVSLLSDMPLEDLDAPEDTQVQDDPPGRQAEGEQDDPPETRDEDPDDPDADPDDDPDADPDEEDDPDADQQQPDDKATFEVPGLLDEHGKPQRVTLDELRNGYLRQQDYTRKTQQVAEARKHVETEWTGVRELRTKYAQSLDHLDARIAAFEPTAEQLAQLKQTDPVAWMEAREMQRQVQEDRQRIEAERQRVAAEEAEDQQKRTAAYAKEQGELLTQKLPQWRDPKVRKAELDMIYAYGAEIGLSRQDLKGVIDHRAVLMLRDAAKFRAMQKAKNEAKSREVRSPRAVAKPGSANQTQAPRHRKAQQSLARAKQTGRVQDAAAAILDMLPD